MEKKKWKEHENAKWTGLKWSTVDSTMVKNWMWTEKLILILTKNQKKKKVYVK